MVTCRHRVQSHPQKAYRLGPNGSVRREEAAGPRGLSAGPVPCNLPSPSTSDGARASRSARRSSRNCQGHGPPASSTLEGLCGLHPRHAPSDENCGPSPLSEAPSTLRVTCCKNSYSRRYPRPLACVPFLHGCTEFGVQLSQSPCNLLFGSLEGKQEAVLQNSRTFPCNPLAPWTPNERGRTVLPVCRLSSSAATSISSSLFSVL